MTTRELLHVQVHDPGRGSFLVNPLPVKTTEGLTKRRRCTDGRIRPVYRAGHYRERTAKGSVMIPHPDFMDFCVMDKSVKY